MPPVGPPLVEEQLLLHGLVPGEEGGEGGEADGGGGGGGVSDSRASLTAGGTPRERPRGKQKKNAK
jgi:hypothetical protein